MFTKHKILSNKKLYEHFFGGIGGGSRSRTTYNTDASYDVNTNIDRSMVVNSVNNIVNTAISNVATNNSAQVLNQATASNQINIINVECEDVIISDIRLRAKAQAIMKAQLEQNMEISIDASISNDMSSQIQNSFPNDTQSLVDSNNAQMKKFLDKLPEHMTNTGEDELATLHKVRQSILAILAGPFGLGTPEMEEDVVDEFNNVYQNGKLLEHFCIACSSSRRTEHNLDLDVKNSLGIDESFNIHNENEVNNEINNTVNSDNFASCHNDGLAQNGFNVMDIVCRRNFIMQNIDMDAYAEAQLDCAFDQDIKVTITAEIITKIEDKFMRMHGNIADNNSYNNAEKREFHDRLFALEDAVGESLLNTNPNQVQDTTTQPPDAGGTKGTGSASRTEGVTTNNTKWIILGVIIAIIIIIGVFFMFKKKDRQQGYPSYQGYQDYQGYQSYPSY